MTLRLKDFRRLLAVSLLVGLSACAAPTPAPTPTALPPTPAATLTPTTTPAPTATATPLACLSQPGRIDVGSLDESKPPQQFMVYLPRCYAQFPGQRYPVLYLLHGQTYTDDQWVRMGAAKVADSLIRSGEAQPFIMVFPDDRYWNLPPGPGFGDRLLHMLIPYVDSHYRTLPDAPHRALGGLSRGGGWAIHMALTQYGTFGIIGLHSPVIFDQDGAMLEKLVKAVPPGDWARIWIDGGDRDGELGNIRRFEGLLTAYEVPHEWRLYSGDHTETYWGAHVREYLGWYAGQFALSDAAAASPTATP